mgnify:CR=1 FL=1
MQGEFTYATVHIMKTKVLNVFENKHHFLTRFWIYFSLIWLVLALFSTTEKLLNYSAQGVDYPIGIQLIWNLANWLPWYFISPVIFYLTHKFSFNRNNVYRMTLFYVLVGIPITVVKVLLYYVMTLPVRGDITPTFYYTNFIDVVYANFLGNYLVYALIILTFYSIHYYRDARKKELKTYQLETQLAKAQLQVLKMQLQPHFLFNTLNSISALVHRDVELADTMITKLSDLLRITLDSTEEQLILLEQEISFLRNYLDIEKIRFQDRLQVEFDIDPQTRNLLVPSLILQPLVENAIKYGVAPYSKLGQISIRSALNNGFLELNVCDNGTGLPKNEDDILNRGIGLRNTKERLEQLFGPHHKFELINLHQGGLNVHIVLPSDALKQEVL